MGVFFWLQNMSSISYKIVSDDGSFKMFGVGYDKILLSIFGRDICLFYTWQYTARVNSTMLGSLWLVIRCAKLDKRTFLQVHLGRTYF